MKQILLVLSIAIFLLSCSDDAPAPNTPVVFDATPFAFDAQGLPVPALPSDYPLTVQRVQLGRMLFHEKMLSRDGSQSCASCHQQKDGASDIRQFSIGVKGLSGTRQAMAVTNLAWHRRGFFWDGRAPTLRDQALHPIQDTLEMDETLPNVVLKLSASKIYREQFVRAFNADTITSELVGIALEQFMLTMISANSTFDKVNRSEASFTETEERGRQLFNTEFDPTGKVKGAECFHCHSAPFFTNDRFMNNGLDNDGSFSDLGREKVTTLASDRARFKVPTLRNIAVTPPYMHDGRFTTLEEVVEHYNTGVLQSFTLDPLLQFNVTPGLGLTQQNKDDLIAFLKTLTDQTFLTNTTFSKP